MDNLLDDRYINTGDHKQSFFDPESKVPTVIGVSVFFMVLAATNVAARLYTRVRILRMTGLDDWLILFASTLVIGHGITQCWMTNFNLGRHVGFMTGKDEFTTFMKLAFLAQFYRIMPGGGTTRRILIIISCVIGLWSTSQMVIVILQCHPVSGFWAPTPDTVCIPSILGCRRQHRNGSHHRRAASAHDKELAPLSGPESGPLACVLSRPGHNHDQPPSTPVPQSVARHDLGHREFQLMFPSRDQLRHHLRLPPDPQTAGRPVLPQALLDPALAVRDDAGAEARVEAAEPQVGAPGRPGLRPGPAARVPLPREPEAGAAAAPGREAADVPAPPGGHAEAEQQQQQ
ncbi:fucose permease [Apiospora phragmitis]|uniref:Fucose permease n=1 Tax=Apiospora phragmitis TaxID=2905665 RepID=A0ABR1U936_9PEZI